jgi:transcriptional regulator with XRE-family HTH domain
MNGRKKAKAPARQTAVRAKAKAGSTEPTLLTGSLAPAVDTPRSLEVAIGAEVRRLRKSLDLTVAELGAAAGVSAGMMSKIENGTISPSLATLKSLAASLNVPITRLFSESEGRRHCSFVKAGQGARIDRRGTKSGHQYDLLGDAMKGDVVVEPYLITLRDDAVPYTHFRHAGVELIYMLSGKVRYRHGDDSYVMEPGDTLCFDAAARHGPEELIEAPMQYLSIIMYQRQE